MTVPLAVEYEAVCLQDEHIYASGLDRDGVSTFLDALMLISEPTETWFLWRPQLRDPGDELVLDAVVEVVRGKVAEGVRDLLIKQLVPTGQLARAA